MGQGSAGSGADGLAPQRFEYSGYGGRQEVQAGFVGGGQGEDMVLEGGWDDGSSVDSFGTEVGCMCVCMSVCVCVCLWNCQALRCACGRGCRCGCERHWVTLSLP
jgi:hypothetical protein